MTVTAQTTEDMDVVERLEDVPAFPTEDEEHRFWATHTLSEAILDRMEPVEDGFLPPPRPRDQVISDALAAEIVALVKAIATEMAERDEGAGTKSRDPYQAVFGELYRHFRVSSYHNIPVRRFGEVMAWLREYQETLHAHGDNLA